MQVLAGLLNIADKADWRNCMFGKEEEIKMVEHFKKRFEAFDPNRWFLPLKRKRERERPRVLSSNLCLNQGVSDAAAHNVFFTGSITVAS